jgi:hypothetical protein
MGQRQLRKKDFEEMLNEKGEECRRIRYAGCHLDLSGMDDYFESWKAQRSDAEEQTGGEGVVFPGYGTWLRKRKAVREMTQFSTVTEFDHRYHDWLQTHA